jgi:hypothetical protein
MEAKDDRDGHAGHPSQEEEEKEQSSSFVTQLTPNDVLFGRGAPSIGNEGNVRFRQLVQSRKREYVSTGKRQVKDWIARQVIHAVTLRHGRFLRKVESLGEAERMGVPEGLQAWMMVEEETILQKVKQALRDRETGEDEETKSAQHAATNRSSSPRRAFVASTNAAAANADMRAGTRADDGSTLDLGAYLDRLQQRSGMQQQVSMLAQQRTHVSDILRARAHQQQQQQQLQQQNEAIARLQRSLGFGNQTQALLDPMQGLSCNYNISPSLGGASSLSESLTESALLRYQGAMRGNAFLNSSTGIHDPYGNLPFSSSSVNYAPSLQNMGLLPPAPLAPINMDHSDQVLGSAHSHSFSASRDGRIALPGSGPVVNALAEQAVPLSEETAGDIAIRAAFSLAKKPFAEVDPTDLLRLSLMEMLLLRVLCSHGLPIWRPATAQEPSNGNFTWSGFGTVLVQCAKDWNAHSPSTDRRATGIATMYASDLDGLARQTVSLLEKVRIFAGASHFRMGGWLQRELCRWAATLEVSDEKGSPVALSMPDIAVEYPNCRQDVCIKSVCLFGVQSCQDILHQATCLTRLRSIFLKSNEGGLQFKVDHAIRKSAATGKMWNGRPSWWSEAGNTLTHDVLLFKRLLAGGFLRVLNDLSGILPGYSTGRELGLTKAAIEERMMQLVIHLHEAQEVADRQTVMKRLAACHLPHLVGVPLAASAQLGVSQEDSEAERYSGGEEKSEKGSSPSQPMEEQEGGRDTKKQRTK